MQGSVNTFVSRCADLPPAPMLPALFLRAMMLLLASGRAGIAHGESNVSCGGMLFELSLLMRLNPLVLSLSCLFAARLSSAQTLPPVPVSAPSVRYELAGNTLRILSAGAVQEVSLGCVGRVLLEHQRALYVGCASQVRVFVLTTPTTLAPGAVFDAGGEVDALFVQAGRVWAQSTRVEARALPTETVVTPASVPVMSPSVATPSVRNDPPTQRAETERPSARVSSSLRGEVVIEQGRGAGLVLGDRVEFYTERASTLGGETLGRSERHAIGSVVELSETRARVQLGMGEEVPISARARRTSEPLTGSLLAPPRLRSGTEVSVAVRPFLPVGVLGFGLLAEMSVTYHMEFPLLVRAVLLPVGIGVGSSYSRTAPARGVATGSVEAAFDHTYFAIGLGVGGTSFSDGSSSSRGGVSITQLLRLGTTDGLHLTLSNVLAVRDDRFTYVGTSGQIQLPIRTGMQLEFEGGGGISGYVFGELGLRVLLRGNGSRDSVFLTPSAGGAALFSGSFGTLAGPMVGLRAEWRPF